MSSCRLVVSSLFDVHSQKHVLVSPSSAVAFSNAFCSSSITFDPLRAIPIMSIARFTTQEDIMNPELLSQHRSTLVAALSLGDMPEEIIQEIAAFLLDDGYHPARPEGGMRNTAFDANPFEVFRTRQGRNVLALSNCSKGMRSLLFARNLLKGLIIHPCKRDLDVINGWPEETRACVR